MTARYNIFKDPTTQCEEPSTKDQFEGTAQCYDQTPLVPPPGTHLRYPNSVKNVPNVRRGHDIS